MKRQITVFALLACFATSVAALAKPSSNPDHVKQLKETRKCDGCDLRDEFLDAVQAEMGSLRDADLRGASLYKANLRGADLTGALFTGANLSGADLRNTKGADLLGATTDDKTKCPGGNAGPCN